MNNVQNQFLFGRPWLAGRFAGGNRFSGCRVDADDQFAFDGRWIGCVAKADYVGRIIMAQIFCVQLTYRDVIGDSHTDGAGRKTAADGGQANGLMDQLR